MLPTSGGSLPLYVFKQELGAATLTVPVASYDNNQHAENKNSRLGNLWDDIETTPFASRFPRRPRRPS